MFYLINKTPLQKQRSRYANNRNDIELDKLSILKKQEEELIIRNTIYQDIKNFFSSIFLNYFVKNWLILNIYFFKIFFIKNYF
jgi:hypothetical protein